MSDLFSFAVTTVRGLALGLGLAPDPPEHPEEPREVQCSRCPDTFAGDGSCDLCPACALDMERGWRVDGALWEVGLRCGDETIQTRVYAASHNEAMRAAKHIHPHFRPVYAERCEREDPWRAEVAA